MKQVICQQVNCDCGQGQKNQIHHLNISWKVYTFTTDQSNYWMERGAESVAELIYPHAVGIHSSCPFSHQAAANSWDGNTMRHGTFKENMDNPSVKPQSTE